MGQPDDIAAVAGFLMGPDASYITGVGLLVDGAHGHRVNEHAELVALTPVTHWTYQT